MFTAQDWIQKLELLEHPEGGYFKEVYRSGETIAQEALPSRYSKEHSFATSIYFLLTTETFSAFHRILSDEIWHFYCGAPLSIYSITPQGDLKKEVLGLNLERQEAPQIMVPRHHWFGACIEESDEFDYTLVGCQVSPGFDFEDFELATREGLVKSFPQHEEMIIALTHA